MFVKISFRLVSVDFRIEFDFGQLWFCKHIDTDDKHVHILFAMSALARPDSKLFVVIFGQLRTALIFCTVVQGAVPPSVMSLLRMGADSGAGPQPSDELDETGKVPPIPDSWTPGKRKRSDLDGENLTSETAVDCCTKEVPATHSSTCLVVDTAERPTEPTQADSDESIFVTLAERELKDLHDKQASDADDENLTPLQMALQQGKFDARWHIGQGFTMHLRKDPADAPKYKACETNKEKAAFRCQWLQNVVKGEKSIVKEEKKSYKTVDATKGTYLILWSIAEKNGLAFDRKAAIAAATQYCTACVRMGGEWSRWDDMAEVMLFLYIKTENRLGRSSRKRQSTRAKKRWNWTAIAFHSSRLHPLETNRGLGRLCLPSHNVLLHHCRHRPQQTTNAAPRSSGSCKEVRIGVGQCCRAACGRTRPVYVELLREHPTSVPLEVAVKLHNLWAHHMVLISSCVVCLCM